MEIHWKFRVPYGIVKTYLLQIPLRMHIIKGFEKWSATAISEIKEGFLDMRKHILFSYLVFIFNLLILENIFGCISLFHFHLLFDSSLLPHTAHLQVQCFHNLKSTVVIKYLTLEK